MKPGAYLAAKQIRRFQSFHCGHVLLQHKELATGAFHKASYNPSALLDKSNPHVLSVAASPCPKTISFLFPCVKLRICCTTISLLHGHFS